VTDPHYERVLFSRLHVRALDEDLHLRAQERAEELAEAHGGRLADCFCGGEQTRVIEPGGGWECTACGRSRDPRHEREAQLADLRDLAELTDPGSWPGEAEDREVVLERGPARCGADPDREERPAGGSGGLAA
jgi:hypothetical protein